MTIVELFNKAQAVGLYLTAGDKGTINLVKIKADDERYKNDMNGLSIHDVTIIVNTLHNVLIKGVK
jgi:hypothetical protein